MALEQASRRAADRRLSREELRRRLVGPESASQWRALENAEEDCATRRLSARSDGGGVGVSGRCECGADEVSSILVGFASDVIIAGDRGSEVTCMGEGGYESRTSAKV